MIPPQKSQFSGRHTPTLRLVSVYPNINIHRSNNTMKHIDGIHYPPKREFTLVLPIGTKIHPKIYRRIHSVSYGENVKFIRVGSEAIEFKLVPPNVLDDYFTRLSFGRV
jgi:hypothetical protein